MQSLFILADESPLDLQDWQVQPLSWSSSLVKSESSWQQLCVWSQSLRQALFNMCLYRVLSREAAANSYLFSVFHPKTSCLWSFCCATHTATTAARDTLSLKRMVTYFYKAHAGHTVRQERDNCVCELLLADITVTVADTNDHFSGRCNSITVPVLMAIASVTSWDRSACRVLKVLACTSNGPISLGEIKVHVT